MKKKVLVGGIVGFFMMGSITVFAWVIPGVTIPFDSANYYNPLTISIADSAPSIFTMRNLAGNGFQVQDVKSNSQSIVSQIKTLIEMINQITSLTNDIKDLTGMSGQGFLTHYNTVDGILKNVNDTRQAYTGLMSANSSMDGDWNTKFRSTDNFPTKPVTITEKQQKDKDLLVVVEATYKDAMATAKMAGDSQAEIKALEDALNCLSSVSGEVENAQVKTQIDSIMATLAVKRNLLISNLVAVKATMRKMEMDREIKDREAVKEGAAFGVNDPYHPTSYDEKKFTRPKGQGMINF